MLAPVMLYPLLCFANNFQFHSWELTKFPRLPSEVANNKSVPCYVCNRYSRCTCIRRTSRVERWADALWISVRSRCSGNGATVAAILPDTYFHATCYCHSCDHRLRLPHTCDTKLFPICRTYLLTRQRHVKLSAITSEFIELYFTWRIDKLRDRRYSYWIWGRGWYKQTEGWLNWFVLCKFHWILPRNPLYSVENAVLLGCGALWAM